MFSLLVKRPAYIILALFLAIFLFVIYFILNNFPVFTSIARITLDPILLWKVFANQVSLIWEIGGPVNVLAVGAVSILSGLSISLTVFRVRRTKVLVGRANLLTLFGSFGGAFGAACSACNASLIALLGISGGLAIFPFKGLEISILALILLTFSLYYTSKSISEWGIK
ncbi:MAG TPA: hypothetical protein VKC89_01925 [Patescibacteria group bacterium]|nr:hypothetical protein [Patescibacteria group bacterium]